MTQNNPFKNETNPEQLIASAAATEDKALKSAALKQLLMIATQPEHIIKGLLDYTDAIEKSKGMLSPMVMNNQSLVSQIVFSTAIRELNDQEVIARLALLPLFKTDLRKDLIEKCTDQSVLVSIIADGRWNNGDAGILAAKATHGLTDPALLAKLLTDKTASPYVREAAAWKVEDQNILEQVASDASDNEGIRGLVAKRIKNQNFLKLIIEKCPESYVRCGAIQGITDQDYLVSIAFNNTNKNEQEAAARMITSPELAVKLFHEATNNEVKAAALRNVKDQRVILEAALDESAGFSIKFAAQDSLTDEAFRKEFFLRCKKDEQARRTALAHIKDQEFLADVTYNDHIAANRMDALMQINDPGLLFEISQLHSDPAVKSQAQEYLRRWHQDFIPSGEPSTAQNLRDIAIQLIDKGQTEEAKRTILTAINLDPFVAQSWTSLAKLLATQGEISESADMMKRAAVLGDEKAKTTLAVEDRGEKCSFCGQQVSALQTVISSGDNNICVDCLELSLKVVSARTPYIEGAKRRGLVTAGPKPCSFCNKNEYRTLVDGGSYAICDECIDDFFKLK